MEDIEMVRRERARKDRMMRLIVAGSRGITDDRLLYDELDRITQDKLVDEVVSGGARGPDTIGAEWAKSRNIPVTVMKADWSKHGRKAGYIRNNEMALYSTHLVAFWDGKSKGTKHMINIAKKLGLEVRVIKKG